MAKIYIVFLCAILSACSAGRVTCSEQICAAANGALMIKDIYAQDSAEKCSDMRGSKRERCQNQVDELNASIAKHTKR